MEELSLAEEELAITDSLLSAGYARVALVRAYFAVFHAARARLYASGFEPRTHAGVHHLFNLHFVKTARFEPGVSRLMARLQKYREEADYARAFVVDADSAREEIEAARIFVKTVRAQLATDRRLPPAQREGPAPPARPFPRKHVPRPGSS